MISLDFDYEELAIYKLPIKLIRQIKPSSSFDTVSYKNSRLSFINKCEECSYLVNFLEVSSDKAEIEAKSTLLIQIMETFESTNLCRMLDSNCFHAFLEMVKNNIFRAIPKIPSNTVDAIEISWPHLKLVYGCLKKSLILKYFSTISKSFLYNLLKNIVSNDRRERNAVKEIIIDLHSKFNNLYTIICNCIVSILSIQLCSNELFELICRLELLDTNFYIDMILPVHLLSASYLYPSLIDCDLIFCRFDIQIFPILLQYLLNHWPITENKKQILFLKIIFKIFETCIKYVTFELSNAFFDVVSLCIQSDSADTAKYALELIESSLFSQIYPISEKSNFKKLYESILIAKSHWDETIRLVAVDSMLAISHLDRDMFRQISLQEKHEIYEHKRVDINDGWKVILKMARKNEKSLKIHFNS